MRKIILVFSLLFVGTSFANVNLEAINHGILWMLKIATFYVVKVGSNIGIK